MIRAAFRGTVFRCLVAQNARKARVLVAKGNRRRVRLGASRWAEAREGSVRRRIVTPAFRAGVPSGGWVRRCGDAGGRAPGERGPGGQAWYSRLGR